MASKPDLIQKPGTKSHVWTYFGVEKPLDGRAIANDVAVCRTCHRKVAAKNGNTSNLLAHLRLYHGRLHSEAKAAMTASSRGSSSSTTLSTVLADQPTITESIEKNTKYEKKGKRWKELTESVAYCVAKDSLPIRAVEKPGFKRLLGTFDSRYEIPSRTYFSRTALPDLYTKVRHDVTGEFKNVRYFSATSDLWSSEVLQPYISYTVHFVKDGKLRSRCLETKFLPQDHTGENIAESLEETLSAWQLKATNQVSITTDSGANVVNATKKLEWARLSCFSHNLHLGVTKALKSDTRCNQVLAVCHKIVAAFSGSWKRKRELTKTQINLDLPQHSLITVSVLHECMCMSQQVHSYNNDLVTLFIYRNVQPGGVQLVPWFIAFWNKKRLSGLF